MVGQCYAQRECSNLGLSAVEKRTDANGVEHEIECWNPNAASFFNSTIGTNDNVSFYVNGFNPTTPGIPLSQHSAEIISAGMIIPPSATVHGGLAIAGYAVNNSTRTEAAALYGWCVSGGNNIRNCEGLNVLATGTENATGNRRIGIEADVGASPNETVTAQYGVLVTGANRGNPPTQGSVGFALSPSAGTTNPWLIGFLTADGSVRTFAQAGALCYTGICGSQLLQMRSFYGGRGLYSYVGSSAPGDIELTPSANRNVQLDLGTGKGVHLTSSAVNKDFAGTCVFSSGTTCSISYADPFASTPVVILTPVNPGSITFTLTSTHSLGFTITASEPNSSIVNYIVLGNPN